MSVAADAAAVQRAVRPVYREYAPARALAGIVACYWTVRSVAPLATAVLSRVLPDGCIDVIFNFGDELVADGVAHERLRSYVVGPMRTALPVPMVGRVDTLGVRFAPGAGAAFARVPLGELVDLAVDLADVDARMSRTLPPDALVSRSDVERIAAIEGALLRRVDEQTGADAVVAEALARIGTTCGRIAVRQLVGATGVSERRLQRLFTRDVGLSPGAVAGIMRVQHAARRLAREPALPLARLAFDCGYADQSHFTREFRRLAGIAPGAYRAERAATGVTASA